MFRVVHKLFIYCVADDGRLATTTLPFIVCGAPNYGSINLITIEEQVIQVKEKDSGYVYGRQKPMQLYTELIELAVF